MQLEELKSENYTGPKMHYMGIFLEDDAALATKMNSSVAGKLMSQWWDGSAEAGSKRRPRSAFSEPTPSLDVLLIGDDQSVKNLVQNVSICFMFPHFPHLVSIFQKGMIWEQEHIQGIWFQNLS